MSRFLFEPATAAHDADLRRLFAENAMEGEIEVSFRREPSYFYASQVQGPFHQVIAVRDTRTGEVIGVATRAVRSGFLNGQATSVGYLADMRLDSRYRSGLLVARAYRYLEGLHQDGRTRLYFTVIADGNRRALETLAAGRAGLPPYRDLGRLLSPAVNLLRPKPPLPGGVEVVRGSEALLPEIVACLNRNGSRRQFAPCYSVEQFLGAGGAKKYGGMGVWVYGSEGAKERRDGETQGCMGLPASDYPIHNPRPAFETPIHPHPHTPALRDFFPQDFYAAVRKGQVVGVVGKWDQSAYKQTVVTRYRGKVRLLRPLYNLGASVFGCPRFPDPGTPLRSFYAAFIAVDHDDVEVFRALLRRLYNDHVGSGYTYFLAGLHERDPLAAALSDYSLTPFAGRLFAVHFSDGEEAFRSLDDRVPYVELAML